MKKLFALLPFSFLGGLITFLGGMSQKLEVGTIAFRTILAIMICPILIFVLLYLVSKILFPGIDLYPFSAPQRANLGSINKQNDAVETINLKDTDEETIDLKIESEEDRLIALSKRHKEGQLNADELAEQIWEETQGQNPSHTIQAQMRNADSQELAGIVRHSMNKG